MTRYGWRGWLVHLALAIGLGWIAPAGADPRAPLIWAFGDSLAAGYGLPPDRGFTAQLQAALRRQGVAATVRNGGVAGDTAAQGRARLRWGLRGLPVAQARANLDQILAELARRRIPILLVGMRAAPNLGPDYARAFEGMYPALARAYRVPLYPFFLEGVAANRALIQRDGLHPNARGVSIIVERILPAVRRALH